MREREGRRNQWLRETELRHIRNMFRINRGVRAQRLLSNTAVTIGALGDDRLNR
jgi:hypothetical protein